MKKLKAVKKLQLNPIKIAKLNNARLALDTPASNASTCMASCGVECSVITCTDVVCRK